MRFLIALLLSVSAWAQLGPMLPDGIPFAGGGAGGTFTLRNSGSEPYTCAVAGSGTTCTFTQGTTAGDLDLFDCTLLNAGSAVQYISSITSGVGTLIVPVASQMGGNNASEVSADAYILPSTSLTHAANIVLTLNAAGSGSAGAHCTMTQWTPSANGSQVNIDNDFAYQPTSNCSGALSCTNGNVTFSGTNDFAFQGFTPASGYTGATAVSSPYSTFTYFPSLMGFSWALTPSNGNGASFTPSASANPLLRTLSFGFNPSTFLPQQYQGFEGGIAGNNPAPADLLAGSQGWAGCAWSYNAGTAGLTYATAASMPLLNNTGRLGDGSSAASGSGTLGLQATSTGSTLSNIACTFQYSSLLNAIIVAKVNNNAGAGDNSDVDAVKITASNDFASSNDYGTGATRYRGLETAEGNGIAIFMSGGTDASQCGTLAGQGCTEEIHFNNGGGGITASSVTAAVSAGVVTFTGTFTASQWPIGFLFTPSGCTGGTNYNGAMFIVASASASTVTASSTSYVNGGTTQTTSGSPTTCTLTGVHGMFVYDKTGTLIGTSFHAGAASAGVIGDWSVGDSTHTVTNADVFKWDSVMFSFNTTVPAK